jgi:hypothetical protein
MPATGIYYSIPTVIMFFFSLLLFFLLFFFLLFSIRHLAVLCS